MENQNNNFQACASLELVDEHAAIVGNGGDALAALLNLQQSIQEEVYGFDFGELRKGYKGLMRFLNWNYGALQDEWREFYTALGGMSAFGLSFWKPWKANHIECQASSFEKLSESDKLEAIFEIIDIMHFMFNMAIVLDIKPQDIKFFFWNPGGEYRHTMVGNETLDMMLVELRNSPETVGKYNAIRHDNERLLDFVDHTHKVWQGRMITLFEVATDTGFGWYLGNETADKRSHLVRRVDILRPEVISNWVEAFKSIMHIATILGLNEPEITNLYYSKNLENRRRQQKPGGY